MNFKWFGPIALLAALVIGDQIRINRPGHKFRLTVEVETPEGRKSASGVLAVHPDRGYSRGGRTRSLPIPTSCCTSLISCTNFGPVSSRRSDTLWGT